MYTLYYAPGACSFGPHVALIECGQPFKLEKVDLQGGQQRSSEFLKINPSGQIPVLVEGDLCLSEGAAIMMHILDKHDSPLLPKSGRERAVALQWLMFANATLHPAYARVFFLKRHNMASGPLMDAAAAQIATHWETVERRLSAHPYICGNAVTAADILLTVIANWSGNVPGGVSFGPHTTRLLKEISSRPSYQQAMREEQVDYKAAA